MQLLQPQHTASPQMRKVEAAPRKSPAYEDGQHRRKTTAQNATPRWGKTQATRQNSPMRCNPITESTGRRNRQRTADKEHGDRTSRQHGAEKGGASPPRAERRWEKTPTPHRTRAPGGESWVWVSTYFKALLRRERRHQPTRSEGLEHGEN